MLWGIADMNSGLLTPRVRFYTLFHTHLYFTINEIIVLMHKILEFEPINNVISL